MARARARQAPPTSDPPQPAGASTPTGKIAALEVGQLLPATAVEVGAPLVPAVQGAAAAAAAVASAKALARILAAFDLFERRRRPRTVERLTQTLTTLYPERTPEEIDTVVREEMKRESEFERKTRERLDRDLPEALKIEDPAKRREAVVKVVERERRIVLQRERAAADRAAARANQMAVQAASPDGAFWKLSEHVQKHTPDCVAFGNKFWPWEVLNVIHPKLHPGCACSLLPKHQAVEMGLMHEDQVPDVGDAVERAKAIMRNYNLVHEAGVTVEEVEAYLTWLYEAPVEDVLAESAYSLRYPKGTVKGGEFRPRRGGSSPAVGRHLARRLLRQLLPEKPTSPAQRRRQGHGEWKQVAGRDVFVPEHRHWEREFDGVLHYSPAGSTRVYEHRGDRAAPRPVTDEQAQKVAQERFDVAMDERDSASAVARRALAAHDPDTLPVTVGATARATHDGVEQAGFRSFSNHVADDGTVMFTYAHAPTGARLEVAFRDGKVVSAEWDPGEPPPPLRPLVQGKLPDSFDSWIDDVRATMYDEAHRRGLRDPLIGSISVDPGLYDHRGYHHWDGSIQLGADVRPAIEDAIDAQRQGRKLTPSEMRNVYGSLRTAAHEGLHGVNEIRGREFARPALRALEEATTEEESALLAVKMARRYGLDDVLMWAKAHPDDFKVEGSYSHYRLALDEVLQRGGVPHDRYGDVVDTLKFSIPPGQRLDALAGVVSGKTGIPHDQAVGEIEQTLAGADWHVERGDDDVSFRPLLQPDLSDVADTPPPQHDGVPLLPGARVRVAQPDGGSVEATVDSVRHTDGGSFLATVRYDDGQVHRYVPPTLILPRRASPKASPGGATKDALKGDGPLPMENGLYYRVHAVGAPFGPEHASTVPPIPADVADSSEVMRGIATPKPGYSAFWNPHHLVQYVEAMDWGEKVEPTAANDYQERAMKGVRVIAFRGTPIGEGSDGEPRVMPESSKVEARMAWGKFVGRTEVTPNGYGMWDEHTWGDGPDGPIADDGYRTIAQMGEATSKMPVPDILAELSKADSGEWQSPLAALKGHGYVMDGEPGEGAVTLRKPGKATIVVKFENGAPVDVLTVEEAPYAERLHPRDRRGRWRGKLGLPRLVLKAEKKLTKPQVRSRVQQVADAVVDFYGGDKVNAHYEPEYLANVGSDARFRHEGEVLPGLLYGTRAHEHIHHPDFGVEWFRVMAHEAAHSLSGVKPGPNPGFSQTFEEGGAEILSLWFWKHRGQEFDHRDATRRDGRWTDPGLESLANHVAYREWTEETLKRAASKVGWDRHAIIDEVESVMRGDHGDRLRFRDTTTTDVKPPEGVGDDAVSLIHWLLSDEHVGEAAFEERLHPRGRAGEWVAKLYHGTSRSAAKGIRERGFRSRSGIIFATSHSPEARDYAGDRGEVVPVTVHLKNPLVVHEHENLGDKLRSLGVKNPSASPESEREQTAALRKAGHDGIVHHLREDKRDPSDPKPARTVVRVVDPGALRVGHGEDERVEAKPWSPPPPPVGKQGQSRGGKGYSSDAAFGTNTALGHVGEAAFVKILGGRILHPEGKGAQSPLDVHFDGYGFEVKAVSTKTLGYKATPKPYEIEQKEAAAKELGVKPALAIVVVDSDGGEAHAYFREGLAGGRLSENTGWKYLGSTKLDDRAAVERAHVRPDPAPR